MADKRCGVGAGGPHSHGSPSDTPRDVKSVKAQINGILHEDSLPYYDQASGPSVSPRQTPSLPLTRAHSHTPTTATHQSHGPSPRARMAPTRLQTQGSLIDLGDLGVSSPSGMSRANSRDSGHISSQALPQYASGSWQGRLAGASAQQSQQASGRQYQQAAAHHSSAHGSAYSSLEAMLSSIPESLSGMPSLPTVPSMSDIERTMQSSWSSFTGSLGLSAVSQQQAATPAGWTAFADEPPSQAAPGAASAPAASREPSSSGGHQSNLSSHPGRTGAVQTRLSVASSAQEGQSPSGGPPPLTSPRKKPIGLQSIDPLTAAKEAASVPLRAMSSFRQELSPRAGRDRQASVAPSTQGGTSRATDASPAFEDAFVPRVDASPSNDWSDFAAASPEGSSGAQHAPRQSAQLQNAVAAQGTSGAAGTDLWAQWSVPSAAQDKLTSQHTDEHQTELTVAPTSAAPLASQHSLLDM